MNKERLNRILEQHKLWLKSKGREGKRADLREANLYRAELRETNLREVDLRKANLIGADLREANLQVVSAKGCRIMKAKFSSKADKALLMLLGATDE